MLKIHKRTEVQEVQFTADRRLYLAVDRLTVVEEGDQRACFLLANTGDDITKEQARTLGLEYEDGKIVTPESKKDAAAKAARKAEDKAARKSEDKKVTKTEMKSQSDGAAGDGGARKRVRDD